MPENSLHHQAHLSFCNRKALYSIFTFYLGLPLTVCLEQKILLEGVPAGKADVTMLTKPIIVQSKQKCKKSTKEATVSPSSIAQNT